MASYSNSFSNLGNYLIRLHVLQPAQWESASKGAINLPEILRALEQQRAWWDSCYPALSAYQCECIATRFSQDPQGFRDLDRDLRVNNYLIINTLGAGGTALVHKAWSLEMEQIVAVKRAIANSQQIVRDRLERESRILSLLDHPRIPQHIAYEQIDDGTSYHLLAMECVDGRSLRETLKDEERISPEDAISWTIDILEALAYAHSRGIIHRDVHPHNIMIRRVPDSIPRQVALLDFGFAKVTASPVHRIPEIAVSELTENGDVFGNLPYMSPEQCRGASTVKPATDIYSLGCTLYAMLAGRPPFIAPSRTALILSHIQSPPPDIRQFCSGLPKYVTDAIDRMLSKDQSERSDANQIRLMLVSKSSLRPHSLSPVEPITDTFAPDRHQSPPPEESPAPTLEDPVLPWWSNLFPASDLALSSRFVDPFPTPVDIARSTAGRIITGVAVCLLIGVIGLIRQWW